MKKKILSIAVVVCFVAIAGANMLNNSSKESISGLLSENVEALAAGEAVQIPCAYKHESICVFETVDAKGKKGEISISNQEKF